jgi:hypothetical protein
MFKENMTVKKEMLLRPADRHVVAFQVAFIEKSESE